MGKSGNLFVKIFFVSKKEKIFEFLLKKFLIFAKKISIFAKKFSVFAKKFSIFAKILPIFAKNSSKSGKKVINPLKSDYQPKKWQKVKKGIDNSLYKARTSIRVCFSSVSERVGFRKKKVI